jgi:hypothetical protein
LTIDVAGLNIRAQIMEFLADVSLAISGRCHEMLIGKGIRPGLVTLASSCSVVATVDTSHARSRLTDGSPGQSRRLVCRRSLRTTYGTPVPVSR